MRAPVVWIAIPQHLTFTPTESGSGTIPAVGPSNIGYVDDWWLGCPQKNSFTADIRTCSFATAMPTRCMFEIWSTASISRTLTGSISGKPS